MPMQQDLDRLFALDGDLAAFDPAAQRLVRALRIAVIARQADRDPLPPLFRLFGDHHRARLVVVLSEAISACWPCEFMLGRPCCRFVGPDERLLATMGGFAGRGDRPGFDRACEEMLGGDARNVLFGLLRQLRAEGPGPSEH